MTLKKNKHTVYKTVIPHLFYIFLGLVLYLILDGLYQHQYSMHSILLLGFLFFFASLFCITVFFQIVQNKTRKKQEKQLSILRHDVKGLLSPTLLQADRILLNKSADQKTIQSAEAIITSIEQITQYLDQTRDNL